MPRRLSVLIHAVVVALGFGLLGAPAQAAPPPHIGLDQLRTMLDANPSGIQGYFLTVPGGPTAAQQDPVQVAMTVRAVADLSGPDGALILFEADMTDPVMQNLGGIAQGMSGSPLFIDDGGTYKMIGALSYGDYFTLNGLGLATPIEYMIGTEQEFPPIASVLTLDEPVRTDSAGTVDRIRIGDQPAKAAGTVTMQPMFGLQITGIPRGTAAYRRFETLAERSGLPVLNGANGQCNSGGFTTPYAAGSSLGAYYTLGSVNLGGYGTVTYRDGDSVMGFGHPMDWVGRTDLFATNVWISGIWGSSQVAYKIGCPGQIQGALTQDRSAGVGVDTLATTATTSVTSQMSVTTDKTRTGSSATQIAAGTFQAHLGDLASAIAVSEPLYRLANQSALAGSARTTTTVTVSDGSQTYTIARPNIWSSPDVLGDSATDTYMILSALFGTSGIVPTVQSVDLSADIDQNNRTASIVGVAGGPLQVGQNTLTVTLKPRGGAKVSLPVTIDVPANAVLDGGLSVDAGSGFGGDEESTVLGSLDETDPDSLGELVKWIETIPGNNQLVVSMADANGNVLRVGQLTTDYALEGSVSPGIATGSLTADLPEAMLGDQVHLDAFVSGPGTGEILTLQQQLGGTTTWEQVGTAPVVTTADGMTGAGFDVTPEANTTYRVTWPGNEAYLGWSASTGVTVSPPLAISGRRRGNAWAMSVTGAPEAAGWPVDVQARRKGRWVTVASGTLGSDGTSSLRWTAGPAGARVRAVMPASPRFAGATSPPTALRATEVIVDPDGRTTRRGNVTIAVRGPGGQLLTGVRYRVQSRGNDGWEPLAAGRVRRNTRMWLANGDYRVVVPKQKRVAAVVRQPATVGSATILITHAASARGRAQLTARPAIPLRFTVQRQQAGRWQTVGGWRRIAPPESQWSRALAPGRYRFVFPNQGGFAGTTSQIVRVR